MRPSAIRSLSLASLIVLSGATLGWAQSPPSNSDKQSDGKFTGIALITDDAAWYEKFQRPEIPQINGRDHFSAGQRGALAVIFSNAKPLKGMIKVLCDVTSFDSEGSRVLAKSAPCYEGPDAGTNVLYPTLLDLNFKIGPKDNGQAGFAVTLHDVHSGRAVDLKVSFAQGDGG